MSTLAALEPAAPETDPTDLLHRAATGDQAAWREVIRRYTPLLHARMRTYRLQEADRFDIAQTVWLRLAENIGRIHTPAHLGGWLATVVTRECQMLGRSAGRTVAAGDLLDLTVPCPAKGPDEIVVAADIAFLLAQAVDTLPPQRRDLVRTLFADDVPSYAEISRMIGIPVGGIGPTRARALRQLRSVLEHDISA